MKVTYISHSGFAVELPSATFLFDYYKGHLPAFEADRPLYVFASHSHGDHFVPQIFDLAKQYPQIHFILSHDIWMMRKKHTRAGIPEAYFTSATYMRPHETLRFPQLTVTTLRSTDLGVAFLVECDGRRIYHAGDLHWWAWPGDTKQAANNMAANYQHEIAHLVEVLSTPPMTASVFVSHPSLDLAFLPLDGRLEENYGLGMEHFLRQISVQHVFPMHFWDDYHIIQQYLKDHPSLSLDTTLTDAAPSSNIYKINAEQEFWSLL